MKWSKLFLIDLTLMLNVYRCLFYVVIIIVTRLLATSRIITQYFNHLLLFNFTTSPLKLMSHYHFSNFAIYGLEHSETDMNS